MKYLITFLFSVVLSFSGISQSLIGAWENETKSDSGETLKTVLTYTDGYQVWTTYNPDSGDFVGSKGGSWTLSDKKLTQHTEFDSEKPENVGTDSDFEIDLADNSLTISDVDGTFKRVDDGTPGDLAGAWLITGRTIDGKTSESSGESPRKTMKILSGTRFQWIAYDTDKKQFMGTGGGTYTTKNGKYTESIAFFPKDSSRVGMDLSFDYELTDEGDWHHTGLSSQGDPIDEVWSLRP